MIYVIFNNGFSAYDSYYAEKMMSNLWRCKRVIGIIFMLTLCVGFAQAHFAQEKTFSSVLETVNNSISLVLGTGGGFLTTDGSVIFFALLKVFGFIFGLYIAKHFNLGYDTIMDMKLED